MRNNVGLQTAYWSGTTPELDIHQIIARKKEQNYNLDNKIKLRNIRGKTT